ncbi:MAG: nickel pincer cofactor biosynthesis protein LarB [Desulfobacterota bacterium]|nr:nickel pincer cofactor biosynthesis protein LarB [Thermodesulfobacteriota bacterium]
MKEEIIRGLLTGVKDGTISIEEALRSLRDLPYQDLFHTKVDHHREFRKKMPEVIYGEGKSVNQIIDIIRAMRQKGEEVLATRISQKVGKVLKESFPEGEYFSDARCFMIKTEKRTTGKGLILIISAGTSDMPVAEEAYVTSIFFGNETERLYDVGVAGIHRLFENIELLRKARVIIVVAGMEGALPSVVAGVVGVPVIGVPTSVGYGASFSGLSALLTMLNSCATVAVFNIDNGFGAAYFATLINRL